jgi:hypothetical protein
MSSVVAGALALSATVMPLSSVEPVVSAETPAHETVESGLYVVPGMFNGWPSTNIGLLRCPDNAPYLNDTEYHPNSGWRIPRGVEVTVTGGNLDMVIWGQNNQGGAMGFDGVYTMAGGATSSATNWSLDDSRFVVKLHCTTQPS